MKTVVIASQKGGAGKSTLCAHLAVQAWLSGSAVYVIDTDPQGSLSAWHERRQADQPTLVDLPFESIGAGLDVLRGRGADMVFIDTAPSRSDENAALFGLADLVVIPVRASPADLWAVGATVGQLKAVGVPFVFVLNAVKTNAGITAQAAAVLSQHGRVAETFIGDRTSYAAAMVNGSTAIELAPKGPAGREMLSLHANMNDCLHANMKES